MNERLNTHGLKWYQPPPPNFRDLKISDQNNCGRPEQKNKFGEGGAKVKGDLKF